MRGTRHAGHRRGARVLAALTIALAAALPVVAPVSAPSAVAAPADDCAAPTRTVAGGGWTPVSVAPGEVVRVTGRFTAGVERLPAGGTLCVAAGAVLAPAYLNAAAGVLRVDPGGAAELPWVSVSPGFVLDNAGTTSFQGLNVNGPATLGNAAGATLTVTASFVPSAGTIVNDGTLDLPGGLILNPAATLTSTGRLTVGGSATIDGTLVNTGRARVAQALLLNGSASLSNGCVLEVGGALTHSGGPASSTGLVVVGGTFSTNGTWRQSGTAALSAAALVDDGAVTGFGRYVFTGSTSVQGDFTGDSATTPIAVDVPGSGFDVATGTVANVQFTDLALPAPADYPAPDCAGAAPVPSADVRVDITGPAVAQADGTISYSVTVTNDGPSPAAAVRVVQTLPAAPGELTAVTADQGGVVAGGTVTWDLGTLAEGESRTLTVSGAVPPSGVLTTTVRVTTTTADPDPGNDDATTTTEVSGAAGRPAPSVGSVVYEGVGGIPVLGALAGAPGAPGLQLRFAVTSPAQSGAVALTPEGLFAYLTPEDFAGTDTFTYEVCDNQVPEQCTDGGTATVILHPRAVADETSTPREQPVTVPVAANDAGGTRLTALATPPGHGSVALDPAAGTATYTPEAGFVGDDTFTYQACAVADPADCVTAPVLVHVLAVNRAPQAFLATLETTVDTPVAGPVEVTDPDGDPTTVTRVFAPVLGTSAPDPAGTRYVPPAGFAGQDLYAYVACDGGALCSTGLVGVRVDPVAGDDAAVTTAGAAVGIDVVANDRGTVLPPEVRSAPAHGTATPSGAAVTYSPAAGFTGTDTFTYRVCAVDGSDACAEATVVVTVRAAGGPVTGTPVPGAPAADDPGPADPRDPGDRSDAAARRLLAITGTDAAATATAGALLLVVGGAVTVAVRRRRAR
ncbi:Ig-like domain-containing protein [Cellulomonas hominis]|uniref:Ig-like domain-containing protein n=1 Tax=Cellulomonas hominis TaxID=156981 RepID=UPI001B96F2A9|nr:Ig-like domain-containing protein [Cellulomonas hominis]VTR75416.1 hypothetical protein CHMI_00160 [Cellulomonas hominis]